MKHRLFASATLALTVLLNTGCPPQDPDGNGTPDALTDAQKEAVNAVLEQLQSFCAVFGALNSFGDTRLVLDELPVLDSFGDCPTVSFLRSGDRAVISFDFGSGCSSAATGGRTVSGGFDIRVTISTGAVTVETLNLVIDGRQVSGNLSFTLTRVGAAVTLEGRVDGTLSIEDVSDVTGTFTVRLSATNQQISISEAELTLDDGTTQFDVTLDSLVVDPAANDNFIPQSGSATFEISEDGQTNTLEVTFSGQSPDTGVVDVSVNGSAAIEHTIPVP